MNDFINIASMVIIISPIALGFLAFGGIWFKENFYTDPFYDDYED